MSLLSLMWHYFSVELSEHGKDFSGAVKRTTGFTIPEEYKNRICQLQHLRSSTKREDVVLKYGIKSQEVAYILYHQTNLVIPVGSRILMNKNPLQKVPEFPNETNTDIYEFKGTPGQPIIHRMKKLYEIYLEKNNRWEF